MSGNEKTAQEWLEQGKEDLKRGWGQQAFADFTEAIRLNPNLEQAYFDRGKIRFESLQHLGGDDGVVYSSLITGDGGIADFTEAIRLNPNLAEVYEYRGFAYDDFDSDEEGAISDFIKALRLNPNLQNSRGRLMLCLGHRWGGLVPGSPSPQEIYENIDELIHTNLKDADGLLHKLDITYQQRIQDGLQNSNIGNGPVDEAHNEIEKLFEELNQLTGLERVKKEVRQLIQFVKIQNMRQQQGLGATELSLHTVYYGSPGTGKTTVARIYGKMLKALGLLEKGHLVETDRAGLVANYVGQTANKTEEKINEAMGGILFIDEAYSLYKSEQAAGWDYGSEAIEVLMKRMEDNRNNLAVIVAGYPGPMDAFLNSNEGFKSRFVNYIHFEDYTPAELTQIFVSFCTEHNYSLSEEALALAKKVIDKELAKKEKTFGNARYCRNLFEKIIRYQAQRIGEVATLPTVSQLKTIEAQDVSPLLSS